MASPQIENGYTRIANEILDALAGIRIPGEARQCLDVILRKTYGFHKKEDIIALSQFSAITKLGKARICESLNKLARLNLIITKKGNRKGNIYRFNKDFASWKPLPKKVIITKKGNPSLPITGHTKETTTKDNNPNGYKIMKKNKIGTYNESDSTDSYEDVIDLDTGEEVKDKVSNASKTMSELIEWAVKRRGGGFVNIKKQYKAMSLMRRADIPPSRAKDRWVELEGDEYYKKVGLDWMSVATSFDRKP